MRSLACALAALSACSGLGPDPCVEQGIPGTCSLRAGSATITIPDYGLAFVSSDCGISAQDAANYRHNPFELTVGFGFHDAARNAGVTVMCGPIARAALVSATEGVPLATLCTAQVIVRGQVVDPQLHGSCCGNLTATVSAGTLTVSSNLDVKGNGPMSVQLDIPPTDVAGYDAPTNSAHMMHVEASGLVASDVFGAATSVAPSCQIHL